MCWPMDAESHQNKQHSLPGQKCDSNYSIDKLFFVAPVSVFYNSLILTSLRYVPSIIVQIFHLVVSHELFTFITIMWCVSSWLCSVNCMYSSTPFIFLPHSSLPTTITPCSGIVLNSLLILKVSYREYYHDYL